MECACCGAEMLPDKELEKTIIYKCKQCGLSDTRLKIPNRCQVVGVSWCKNQRS